MLRKRSRPARNEQNKALVAPDSAHDSSTADISAQRSKNGSFFRVPGLFVGLSGKLSSDCDSASSPTSPLEWRGFCNPVNTLVSPKPSSNGSPKCWDCDRVGLSIVDSLSDSSKPGGRILSFSENRNVLLGSQLRISIPSPLRNFAESPTGSPVLNLNSSKMLVETNEARPVTHVLQRSRSCTSDCMQFPLPLTRLVYCNPKSNSDNFCSEKKETELNSSQSMKGEPSFGKFSGLPSSLPVDISSDQSFVSSLSPREIELSEDYTRIISRGPNPKTTHIFGDCILESDTIELGADNKEEWSIGSPIPAQPSDGPKYSHDFLSFCYSCNKKLEQGKDIYMYRGEKAFCSNDCRSLEILVEEETQKPRCSSPDSPMSTSADDDAIFMADMAFAS